MKWLRLKIKLKSQFVFYYRFNRMNEDDIKVEWIKSNQKARKSIKTVIKFNWFECTSMKLAEWPAILCWMRGKKRQLCDKLTSFCGSPIKILKSFRLFQLFSKNFVDGMSNSSTRLMIIFVRYSFWFDDVRKKKKKTKKKKLETIFLSIFEKCRRNFQSFIMSHSLLVLNARSVARWI